MSLLPPAPPPAWPVLAWLSAGLAGVAAPGAAMLLVGGASVVELSGPILAIGLIGAGMIGAAAAGSLRIGVGLALLAGAGLVILARALGMPSLPHPLATGFALVVASISFAARGALFARSGGDKGWLIAVAVVAGEAAMLVTAAAAPGAVPGWLLVLLPAQWANAAIQTAQFGSGVDAAGAALFALAGTAAATLLVARLWPRRWPYLVMFTAWLGCAALVWHAPAPPTPQLAGPSVLTH